jgi:hypothetical protein
VTRRSPRNIGARKGWLILVLVGVFLTLGVPRWLAGDVSPVGSNGDASFAKLCREHEGTPATTPGSGTEPQAQRCTVRYGRNVYVMDAITPRGFDSDTAHFQRDGCEEAQREQRASTDPGEPRRTFVYHPTTGVCEHRP